MADSVKIKQLIPSPITTVVICGNNVKTVRDPLSADSKQSELSSTYIGDVCPALKTETFNEEKYVQVQNGYNFERPAQSDKDNADWKWMQFRLPQQVSKLSALKQRVLGSNSPLSQAQALFIQPPVPDTFDNNYLCTLLSNARSLGILLSSEHTLSKDIILCIFEYMPFTFPIFISCTSIYRGRGSFTHWTYPYTKSKKWMLDYVAKCEHTFDDKHDCFYVSEWFVMKDDAPVKEMTGHYDWIDQLDVTLNFKRNEQSMQRVWNEPVLIARKETKHLNQAIVHRNEVGGSYWLNMKWNKDDANTEWFADRVDVIANKQTVNSEIGGSSGIKSRCWYQTVCPLEGKYLPMSVLNVCCNYKMLQDINAGII